MNTWPKLWCVSYSILIALLATATAFAADAPRKPNIVIIVGDDMGYADVGVHGCTDIPTPHIDSIAKAGVRCTSGYVSGPYCSPTRAGLLTGRYQQRFGHEFNPGPAIAANAALGLPLTETTIADRMKAAGYRTGLVGKWHLGGAKKFAPNSRGFDEFFGFLGGAHTYFPPGPMMAGKQANAAPIFRNEDQVKEPAYLTEAIGREAVAFVEKHADEPFFLLVTFNAVHTPMQAPPKYKEKFADIENPTRRTYAAMMAAMDDAVGLVLAKLRDKNLEENTLVCFISDNGGPPVNASSNGTLRGYKAQTFEGGIRVPFFVQWKGKLPAGKTYDQPVIQLDLTATALAAAGAKVEEGNKFDGVDLLPYLEGKQASPPHENLYWRFGQQMAIRQGKYKLVKGPGPQAKQELFDLDADIGEKNDLLATQPDVAKKLQSAYDAWNAELVPPLWAQQRPNAGAAKKKAAKK